MDEAMDRLGLPCLRVHRNVAGKHGKQFALPFYGDMQWMLGAVVFDEKESQRDRAHCVLPRRGIVY